MFLLSYLIMAYRFSGHETFPFRYTWLPKALIGISHDPRVFADEDDAMVEFGVGKNMVRAMRFWVEVTGLAESTGPKEMCATPLGELLFGEDGLDPFLEDIQTLWILHWNIATQTRDPLFAWDFLFNRWQESELAETPVLSAFAQESERLASKQLSPITLKQHFEVFLHSYLPTRGRKGDIAEDNLDCPLTELELITVVGERDDGGRRREPVYAFHREEKPSISPELFAWALNDYWLKRTPGEKTMPARAVVSGIGGPGQIFKLPEHDVIARLGELSTGTDGALIFQESAALPQVQRIRPLDPIATLTLAFKQKVLDA